MDQFIVIDSKKYQTSELSDDILYHLGIMESSKTKMDNLQLMLGFLEKAREAYVGEITHDVAENTTEFVFGRDWVNKMQAININGVKINLDTLTVSGKASAAALQVLDIKINELQKEFEICSIAHNASVDFVKRNLK